jgi:PadR family transcriptional regulator PadR
MNDSFLTNWVTQLRKGILEYCVLKALEDGPLYGYDLVRRLSALDVIVVSEGTIYPLLSRLRKEGLLKTHLEESSEGPARKYYELAARGKEVLPEMRDVWLKLIEGVENSGRMKGGQK